MVVETLRKQDSPQVNSPDETHGITPDSWKNIYRNVNNTPPHQVIYDALRGSGGFAGDIESDAVGFKYSYLNPFSTEWQYLTRLANSCFYNFFWRYINASVSPIFSIKSITTIIRYADTLETIPKGADFGFCSWGDSADGGYNSLSFIEQSYCTDGKAHDVIYQVMLPNIDEKPPVLKYYTPKDVVNFDIDAVGNIYRIRFIDSSKIDEVSGYQEVTAIDFNWDGYATTVTQYVATIYAGQLYRTIEWAETNYRYKITKVPYFVVNVLPFGAMKHGEVVPSLPSMIPMVKVVTDIWQAMSLKKWILLMQGHSKLVISANVKGVSAFINSYISVPPSADGKSSSNPVAYVSPDPELPRVHQEDISERIIYMRDLMRETGVSSVSSSTSQSQSGESKSYDFVATSQQLQKNVQRLKQGFKWIFETYMHYQSANPKLYIAERTYPMDFSPKSELLLVDLLDTALALKESGLVENSKEVYRQATRVALRGEISLERQSELDDEIEKAILESIIEPFPNDNGNV